MRLLHTSDWHLGRLLYGKKRYDEFAAFLEWLIGTIVNEKIDVLLVAGDLFDNSTPSNRAQELYYSFLSRIAATCCKHVIITAGNHDSPSFLDAPGALLRALRVHVAGAVGTTPDDEVIVIDDIPGNDGSTAPSAVIICAVPYLRESDLRTVSAGESVDEKTAKMVDGVKQHYTAVHDAALRVREALLKEQCTSTVPIIAMGHLFTSGGLTVEGDGVRELYVGSLAHTENTIFAAEIAYLALGHLHVPQIVGGQASRRYSGSPLAMGFGEALQQKSVVVVTLNGAEPEIALVPVPVFRKLVQIRGDLAAILSHIEVCKSSGDEAWLEILYEGDDVAAQLQERLAEAVAGTALEIVRIRNNRIIAGVLKRQHPEERMEDITPREVFTRCLEAHAVPGEQRPDLFATYMEILQRIEEADTHAE